MSGLFNIETIKYLRNVCYKYQQQQNEKTPQEFSKELLEKCKDEDGTMVFVEMFLELYRHEVFLSSLSNTISNKLNNSESMFMKILLYGIIFRFDEYCFRKYIFTAEFLVGKKVHKMLVEFFRKVDVILIVKRTARSVYDISFVSNIILCPLIKVQPYIQDILLDFCNFKKREEQKRIKPLTVPLHMNVLSHATKKKKNLETVKEVEPVSHQINIKTKVDTGTCAKVHENNLKVISRAHKIDAQKHLLEALSLSGKYANPDKSEKYHKTIENIKNERTAQPKNKWTVTTKCVQTPNPIKTNVSTLLRFSSKIIREQENEIKWIEQLCSGSYDSAAVDDYSKQKRKQEEIKNINRIERRHLEGLISREDAIIAKDNLLKKNKENYEEFQKERKEWEMMLNEWKAKEQERIKIILANTQEIKKAATEAKQEIQNNKKEIVQEMKCESDIRKNKMMEEKYLELKNKTALIKEIKTLHYVIKNLNKDKEFDFTESSGIGSLCEMSLAELKERLAVMKIDMNEELESRKHTVANLREQSKAKETRAQEIINEYLQDREKIRMKMKNNNKDGTIVRKLDKEISDLRSQLQEKRELREQILVKGKTGSF